MSPEPEIRPASKQAEIKNKSKSKVSQQSKRRVREQSMSTHEYMKVK